VQGKIVNRHSIFRKLFSNSLLKVIPHYLEEFQFSPEEIVVEENHTNFINKICQKSEKNFIYIMTEGLVILQLRSI